MTHPSGRRENVVLAGGPVSSMMVVAGHIQRDPGVKMASQEQVLFSDRSLVDLHAPTRTHRISFDVDVAPAELTTEQVCGLLVSALESAYPFVRGVRINQCSSLTHEGMNGSSRR